MDLLSLRSRFEPHLACFLLEKRQTMQAYTDDPLLRTWLDEPGRLLGAGGKRIRPLLLVLGYWLAGGTDDEAAFQASVGLELFHLFALIHDDIMDRGDERHGVPSVHRAIAAKMADHGRRGDLAHVGEAQAIIVGDLLFSWSLEAFLAAPFAAEYASAGRKAFFRMADEVMAGQMLDIDLTTRASSSLEEIVRKMALKTAGYTFTRPLQIGIALAGGAPSLADFADRFGLALGTAFQIQDDVFDAFADLAQTGKTPLSDLRDHQHSLLTHGVLERGSAEDREALRAAWGRADVGPAEARAVRAAFFRSGALDEAVRRAGAELAAAVRILADTPIPGPLRAAFEDLATRAVPPDGLARVRSEAAKLYADPS